MHLAARTPLLRCFLTHLGHAVTMMAIAACVLACDRAEHPAGPQEKATIALSVVSQSLLAEIALAQGYFAQEGLAVTPRLHAYGKPALEDLIAGNADFATVAETPIMFAILDGADISILATIFKSKKDLGIVVRKDRGILAPADLKGRKIAATFGTTSEIFLDTFLAVLGISRKDIELINLPQEELLQALREGKVDAASAFDPFLHAAKKQLGAQGEVFSNTNIYTTTFNIVSTRKFVQKNPDMVGKVLRALHRAEEFYARNPEEGLGIAAERNHEDMATTREILAESSVELSLGESIILTLEDESRWAIENGLTKAREVPNFLEYIYTDGLKSVKPAAVRILE